MPFFGERASLLLVKTEAKVARDPLRLRTFIVLKGAGTIDGGKAEPIAAAHVVVLKGATPVTVRAQGGPLAALVFDAEVIDPKAIAGAASAAVGAPAPAASALP